MKREVVLSALACLAAACTTITPEGAKVKVYEADLKTPAPARALPEGCRLLATTAPVDQMESERHLDDPYRVERNQTAAKGGNILLVLSSRYLTRPMTDCAPSDTSPDCQSRSQNWYKVGFESYACDAAGLDALARIPAPERGGVAAWWPFGKKAPAPAPAAAAAPAPATASSAAAVPAAAPAPVCQGSDGLGAEGEAPRAHARGRRHRRSRRVCEEQSPGRRADGRGDPGLEEIGDRRARDRGRRSLPSPPRTEPPRLHAEFTRASFRIDRLIFYSRINRGGRTNMKQRLGLFLGTCAAAAMLLGTGAARAQVTPAEGYTPPGRHADGQGRRHDLRRLHVHAPSDEPRMPTGTRSIPTRST